MSIYLENKKRSPLYRILSIFLLCVFTLNVIMPPAQAQMLMPPPASMIGTTPLYVPALIKGIEIHPDNPLQFDFIIDTGHSKVKDKELEEEATRMVKYFLAALTVPEKELWVNLSPYEKDRVIPDAFGQTDMGMDLLAQDYILKQLTASLTYPEKELGQKFWNKVHQQAKEQYGVTDIPMDNFNKVWIVPEKAAVYETGNRVFVVNSHLKVLLEEDYLAANAAVDSSSLIAHSKTHEPHQKYGGQASAMSQEQINQVMREIVIPALEKEVNEGEHFARLRQINQAAILAKWYKQALKESLLGKVYVDQAKMKGIDDASPEMKQKIYEQYVEAFKKGAYDYIREDYDPQTQEIIPRHYFSGGMGLEQNLEIHKESTPGTDKAMLVSSATPVGSTSQMKFVLVENLNSASAKELEPSLTGVSGGVSEVAGLKYGQDGADFLMGEPVGAGVDSAMLASNDSGEASSAAEQRGGLTGMDLWKKYKAANSQTIITDRVVENLTAVGVILTQDDFEDMEDEYFLNVAMLLGESFKAIGLNSKVADKLFHPARVYEIDIPFKMDNGEMRVVKGYRIRHSDARGPGKGGIRFHPDITRGTIRALGTDMTPKTALAGVALGGAKGGIAINPKDYSQSEMKRIVSEYVRGLLNRDKDALGVFDDVPAPDVGSTAQHMAWMMEEYEKIMKIKSPGMITGKPVLQGRKQSQGGSEGRTKATGYGVYIILREAVRAFAEKLRISSDIRDLRYSIQGAGNVAWYAVESLYHDGCRKIRFLSDVSGGIHITKDMDDNLFSALRDHLSQNALLSDFTYDGVEHIDGKDVLTADVDVLIPAALQNQLTRDNAGQVKAALIVEGANGPTTHEAEKILLDAGKIIVPDILANGGGVTVSAFEWLQNIQGEHWPEEAVEKMQEQRMVEAFDLVASMAMKHNISLRESSMNLAMIRIAEAQVSKDEVLKAALDGDKIHDFEDDFMFTDTYQQLNDIVKEGKFNILIKKSQEMFQQRISVLADEILQQLPEDGVVLISGIATGKAALSYNLKKAVESKELGRRAEVLHLDYHEDMDVFRLLNGARIGLTEAERIYKNGKSRSFLELKDGELLILEGQEAFHPDILEMLEDSGKKVFKVFVNISPAIALEGNQPLTSVDARALVQIMDDYLTLNKKPGQTLINFLERRQEQIKKILPRWKLADRSFELFIPYWLPIIKSELWELLQDEEQSLEAEIKNLGVAEDIGLFKGSSRNRFEKVREAQERVLKLKEILQSIESVPEGTEIPENAIIKQFMDEIGTDSAMLTEIPVKILNQTDDINRTGNYQVSYKIKQNQRLLNIQDKKTGNELTLMPGRGFTVTGFKVNGRDVFYYGEELEKLRGIFLLGPWVNRLNLEKAKKAGFDIDKLKESDPVFSKIKIDGDGNANHGVLRDLPWEVDNLQEQNGALSVSAFVDFREYPVLAEMFGEVVYRVTYTIKDSELELAYSIKNNGKETAPAFFGAHPNLNVDVKNTRVKMSAQKVFDLDDRALPLGLVSVQEQGIDFISEDGALVNPRSVTLETPVYTDFFTDAKGNYTVEIDDKSNNTTFYIHVDGKAFPYFVLWNTDETGNVLGAEPMSIPADHHNQFLGQNPGIKRGETAKGSFKIFVSADNADNAMLTSENTAIAFGINEIWNTVYNAENENGPFQLEYIHDSDEASFDEVDYVHNVALALSNQINGLVVQVKMEENKAVIVLERSLKRKAADGLKRSKLSMAQEIKDELQRMSQELVEKDNWFSGKLIYKAGQADSAMLTNNGELDESAEFDISSDPEFAGEGTKGKNISDGSGGNLSETDFDSHVEDGTQIFFGGYHEAKIKDGLEGVEEDSAMLSDAQILDILQIDREGLAAKPPRIITAMLLSVAHPFILKIDDPATRQALLAADTVFQVSDYIKLRLLQRNGIIVDQNDYDSFLTDMNLFVNLKKQDALPENQAAFVENIDSFKSEWEGLQSFLINIETFDDILAEDLLRKEYEEELGERIEKAAMALKRAGFSLNEEKILSDSLLNPRHNLNSLTVDDWNAILKVENKAISTTRTDMHFYGEIFIDKRMTPEALQYVLENLPKGEAAPDIDGQVIKQVVVAPLSENIDAVYVERQQMLVVASRFEVFQAEKANNSLTLAVIPALFEMVDLRRAFSIMNQAFSVQGTSSDSRLHEGAGLNKERGNEKLEIDPDGAAANSLSRLLERIRNLPEMHSDEENGTDDTENGFGLTDGDPGRFEEGDGSDKAMLTGKRYEYSVEGQQYAIQINKKSPQLGDALTVVFETPEGKTGEMGIEYLMLINRLPILGAAEGRGLDDFKALFDKFMKENVINDFMRINPNYSTEFLQQFSLSHLLERHKLFTEEKRQSEEFGQDSEEGLSDKAMLVQQAVEKVKMVRKKMAKGVDPDIDDALMLAALILNDDNGSRVSNIYESLSQNSNFNDLQSNIKAALIIAAAILGDDEGKKVLAIKEKVSFNVDSNLDAGLIIVAALLNDEEGSRARQIYGVMSSGSSIDIDVSLAIAAAITEDNDQRGVMQIYESLRSQGFPRETAAFLTIAVAILGNDNENRVVAIYKELERNSSNNSFRSEQLTVAVSVLIKRLENMRKLPFQIHPEILNSPVTVLEMGPRILNLLLQHDIETIEDLVSKQESELFVLKGFGNKTKQTIRQELKKYGLMLGMKFAPNGEVIEHSLEMIGMPQIYLKKLHERDIYSFQDWEKKKSNVLLDPSLKYSVIEDIQELIASYRVVETDKVKDTNALRGETGGEKDNAMLSETLKVKENYYPKEGRSRRVIFTDGSMLKIVLAVSGENISTNYYYEDTNGTPILHRSERGNGLKGDWKQALDEMERESKKDYAMLVEGAMLKQLVNPLFQKKFLEKAGTKTFVVMFDSGYFDLDEGDNRKELLKVLHENFHIFYDSKSVKFSQHHVDAFLSGKAAGDKGTTSLEGKRFLPLFLSVRQERASHVNFEKLEALLKKLQADFKDGHEEKDHFHMSGSVDSIKHHARFMFDLIPLMRMSNEDWNAVDEVLETGRSWSPIKLQEDSVVFYNKENFNGTEDVATKIKQYFEIIGFGRERDIKYVFQAEIGAGVVFDERLSMLIVNPGLLDKKDVVVPVDVSQWIGELDERAREDVKDALQQDPELDDSDEFSVDDIISDGSAGKVDSQVDIDFNWDDSVADLPVAADSVKPGDKAMLADKQLHEELVTLLKNPEVKSDIDASVRNGQINSSTSTSLERLKEHYLMYFDSLSLGVAPTVAMQKTRDVLAKFEDSFGEDYYKKEKQKVGEVFDKMIALESKKGDKAMLTLVNNFVIEAKDFVQDHKSNTPVSHNSFKRLNSFLMAMKRVFDNSNDRGIQVLREHAAKNDEINNALLQLVPIGRVNIGGKVQRTDLGAGAGRMLKLLNGQADKAMLTDSEYNTRKMAEEFISVADEAARYESVKNSLSWEKIELINELFNKMRKIFKGGLEGYDADYLKRVAEDSSLSSRDMRTKHSLISVLERIKEIKTVHVANNKNYQVDWKDSAIVILERLKQSPGKADEAMLTLDQAPVEFLIKPITSMKMSEVTTRLLMEAGIESIGSLAIATESDLRRIKGFGDKKVSEVKSALKQMGMRLGMDWNKGGIDLNPELFDLQIKRDGNGVPLPLPQQPIETMNIEGFCPVLINVTPVNSLPMLIGLTDEDVNGPEQPKKTAQKAGMDLVCREEYFDEIELITV